MNAKTPHPSSESQSISAILVSFNTCELTRRAVVALGEQLKIGFERDEVIVVDNASGDGTVAMLRAEFPGVRVIENAENRGFGAANNVGMAAARGDLLLLINTDAFVGPGAVVALRAAAAAGSRSGWGVIGPRLLNEDGSLQRSCFGFPTPGLAWLENLGLGKLIRANRFAHDRASEVDFVSGACMMVRREVFERTGGFDEAFFMYSEETDWQRRIRDAGWEVGFEPAATVTHLGGGSQASGRVNPEFFRSLDRYVRKHHGRLGLFFFRAAMVVGAAARLPVRRWMARRDQRQAAKLRINRFVLRRLLLGEASALAAEERE